jgi:hypothetical protein
MRTRQLAEWRAWFTRPENQLLFRGMYLDWIWDFSQRPLVPHYILIYGRRSEFDRDPVGDLLHHRVAQRREHEESMTLDRLYPNADLSDVTTVYMKSNGRLEVRAIQPCFTTGPTTADLAAHCDDLSETVLEQVDYWDPKRRSYVLKEWRDVLAGSTSARGSAAATSRFVLAQHAGPDVAPHPQGHSVGHGCQLN